MPDSQSKESKQAQGGSFNPGLAEMSWETSGAKSPNPNIRIFPG